MADFLDEKRKEIQARLDELKPYVDEYQLLQAAEQALSGISNGSTSAPAAVGPRAAARAPRRRWTSCASGPASPSRNSPRRWASSRTISIA